MEPQQIQAYYSKDHDRLDSLFKQFQALKKQDFQKAKEFFREFQTGLRRHIIWEEEILFPLFEERAGMGEAGPTVVMRTEHRQIKSCLEAIHDKIQRQDTTSDAEEVDLLNVLGEHNEKEEHILYPAIDQLLNEQNRREVFDRMGCISEDAYRSCCGES